LLRVTCKKGIEIRLLFLVSSLLFFYGGIMQRLKEVLEFLGIPHYLSLPEWDQEDFIQGVQQRRREFRPKKGNGDKLDFSPPILSEKQKGVIDGMVVGVKYGREDLDCSISTLRSLSGKGLLVSEGGEEGIWIRLEKEWV
jgi:hypothetical protein